MVEVLSLVVRYRIQRACTCSYIMMVQFYGIIMNV